MCRTYQILEMSILLICGKTKVMDVSNLGNVHTLDLSQTNVTDVDNLGNVRTLNLYHTKVTDVSNLGNNNS